MALLDKDPIMVDKTMLSDDRVFEIEKIEGESPVAVTGLIDSRLFKGGNKLHAIKDQFNMWRLKYESGGLPEPLKQTFTSFSRLMKHVIPYFEKRGLRIKEVDNG